MKDKVSTESYVEQYAREHKLGKYAEVNVNVNESEKGIPSDHEMGIPVKEEVKKNVKNSRSKR